MSRFLYSIRISPDVIAQEVLLGETLLLDTGSLAYFGLDEFGSRIWREIESCKDAGEVFRRICESSELEPEVLARKMEGVLRGLEMSRIITLEPINEPSSSGPS